MIGQKKIALWIERERKKETYIEKKKGFDREKAK